MLKDLTHNHLRPPFLKTLKQPPIKIKPKHLVIVVEVIVNVIEDSLATHNTSPVLTHVQPFIQNIIIITPSHPLFILLWLPISQ